MKKFCIKRKRVLEICLLQTRSKTAFVRVRANEHRGAITIDVLAWDRGEITRATTSTEIAEHRRSVQEPILHYVMTQRATCRRVRSSESDSFGALPARIARVSLEKGGSTKAASSRRENAGARASSGFHPSRVTVHNELPRAVVARGNPIIPYESANTQLVTSRRVVHFRLCVDEISRRIVVRHRESVSRDAARENPLLAKSKASMMQTEGSSRGKGKKERRLFGCKVERMKVLYIFPRRAAK